MLSNDKQISDLVEKGGTKLESANFTLQAISFPSISLLLWYQLQEGVLQGFFYVLNSSCENNYQTNHQISHLSIKHVKHISIVWSHNIYEVYAIHVKCQIWWLALHSWQTDWKTRLVSQDWSITWSSGLPVVYGTTGDRYYTRWMYFKIYVLFVSPPEVIILVITLRHTAYQSMH